MKNKLLAAVEDYLDDEREYVRFAEKEIQVLEQKARDTVRQTQRRMIAALYWRAGEYEWERDRASGPRWKRICADHATITAFNARVLEAACPR